ncbi:MAG: Calx-beta domain-containing protein, partial [bacterium]
MKKLWKKWISGLLVVAMLAANVPAEAFASMEKDASGKPTSITTAEGGRVQVEESWEEAYPYGAFLFTNSDAALTEGGEETVVSLYRLGGTSGRATAYVVYAPVVAQMTEELTAYGTAAGYGDVEISVEDALPIAQYQPVGKDPEPEPSTVRILEKEAVGEEYEAGDRALYLDGEAESFQWYVFLEDRWQLVEGATDADFVLSEDLLAKYDVRCVFVKDGERFCTDSVKGEAYEKPAEEVLPEAPEDLELAPEKTFTVTDMDPENPYAAQILELTFADGEWVKEIHVRSPENDKAQPLRFGTFTILSNNGGAIFQEASTVTLKVTDNDRDDPYTIGFVEKEITVDRAEGTATLKLHREGGGQDPITVDYETVDGSALAGKDYESVSGTAVFYADVNEVTINIPLLSNGEGGEPLDFTLALKDMKGDAAGLCTLTEEAAVVHLTNAAAGEEKAEASGEEAEDSEESGKTSGAKAAASDEEAETDAELPLPENALPYGGLSGALQEGAEAVGTEPVNGEQVVTPREELLYGEIAGLQGTG